MSAAYKALQEEKKTLESTISAISSAKDEEITSDSADTEIDAQNVATDAEDSTGHLGKFEKPYRNVLTSIQKLQTVRF